MVKKVKDRARTATSWAVSEVDQLLARVARYTRFVLFSKWFLGVFALVLLVGLIVWPLFGKDKSGLRISFVSSDGGGPVTHPVMEAPRFVGNDKNNQQYVITAKRAVQQNPQLVLLERAEGQLLKTDGSSLMLRADSALFHQDTKMIELTGNVNLMDSKGTLFITEKATINTDSMDVDGSAQVSGSSPTGKLVAMGFKIRDSGNSITFGTVPRVNVNIDRMRRTP